MPATVPDTRISKADVPAPAESVPQMGDTPFCREITAIGPSSSLSLRPSIEESTRSKMCIPTL